MDNPNYITLSVITTLIISATICVLICKFLNKKAKLREKVAKEVINRLKKEGIYFRVFLSECKLDNIFADLFYRHNGEIVIEYGDPDEAVTKEEVLRESNYGDIDYVWFATEGLLMRSGDILHIKIEYVDRKTIFFSFVMNVNNYARHNLETYKLKELDERITVEKADTLKWESVMQEELLWRNRR